MTERHQEGDLRAALDRIDETDKACAKPERYFLTTVLCFSLIVIAIFCCH